MNVQKLFKKIKPKYLLMAGLPVLILVAILAIDLFHPAGEFTVVTESSLKEVLLASEVSTLNYTYNSTTAVPSSEKAKYYVAYEGSVKIGFDMADIQVVKEGKTYVVTLPQMEVNDVNVGTTLDYIFIKEKYNNDTVYQEAYNAAVNDLTAKAKSNTNLFELARESAISSVKGWLAPWEAQLEEGYSITVQ